ncbi:MAG TPA: oligosaccharide flippase family protein, partial [Pirellulaceae bacterium]|nr:oligosaccharide flippase family protein [Pirellulaceae bacterium]
MALPAQSTRTKPVLKASALRSDGIVFGVVFALSLTIIQRLLGFARGILFCHLMTDQQLGQFSLIYSWLLTLAPLAVLGMPGTFGRFLEEFRQQGSLGSFLIIISRVSIVTTLMMAAAMLLFPHEFSWQILGSGNRVDLMWATAAALILLTGYNYLVSLVEALRQIRLATIMRFVSGTGFTIVGVAALWFAHPDASTLIAVAAFGASSMLGALPAIWYLKRFRHELQDQAPPVTSRQVFMRIGPYAAWWWMSNLLQNMYELADRYMLVHWTNQETVVNVQAVVGQYHSGRVIPMMLAGLAEMVRGLILPYLTAAWLRGDVAYVRQQMN